jgi:hypothetical protein
VSIFSHLVSKLKLTMCVGILNRYEDRHPRHVVECCSLHWLLALRLRAVLLLETVWGSCWGSNRLSVRSRRCGESWLFCG